jgi:hypothetical protein
MADKDQPASTKKHNTTKKGDLYEIPFIFFPKNKNPRRFGGGFFILCPLS